MKLHIGTVVSVAVIASVFTPSGSTQDGTARYCVQGQIINLSGRKVAQWQRDGTFAKLGAMCETAPVVQGICRHGNTVIIYRFRGGFVVEEANQDLFVIFASGTRAWKAREGIHTVQPYRARPPVSRPFLF